LDASYLVTGNVQSSGPLIRVNVALLNTATGRQIWGQLYDDRRQEDLLSVQGEIATSVATAIVGQLLPRERTLLVTVSAVTPPQARSQPLFESDTALSVTITTDLASLIQKRDTMVRQPGVLSYVGIGGALQRIPLSVRAHAEQSPFAKGAWRLLPRNCDFPSLQLTFESDSVRGTLVSNLNSVEMMASCRPSEPEYEEYIVQEYLVYRALSLITSVSRNTRLARVTYRDALGKVAPITTWAFLLEDVSDLARRINRRGLSARRALFQDLEQEPLRTLSVFEYFIGNTNWSVAAEHNIALLSDTGVKVIPVPYGFDFSGAVNPRYGVADPRLGIRRVTDRLYRGVCMKPEEFSGTIELFRARKADIDRLFTKLPQISTERATRMRQYFDEFWKRTDEPSSLQGELEARCQRVGA
jgi:hypothetical protein